MGDSRQRDGGAERLRALIGRLGSSAPEAVRGCLTEPDGLRRAEERARALARTESALGPWLEQLAAVRTAALEAAPTEEAELRRWSSDLRALDDRVRAASAASADAYAEEMVRVRQADEARLRTAVEASPIGILMVDAEGKILLANVEIERMFGYQPGELDGRPVDVLVPTHVRGRHAQLRQTYAARPEARPMGAGRDLAGVRKDGSSFSVEVGLRPIPSTEGLIVLGTIIDITERTEILKLLADRTGELRRSNEDLQQFAYVVSHDLREPLRAVTNFMALLKRRYGDSLDERATTYVDFAYEGAQRAKQLMDELLDYARLGRKSRPHRPVPIEGCVDRARASLAAVLQETEGTIEHLELPSVLGEAPLLDRLFHNLIDNAIKFRSEAPPRIRIDAQRQGERWTVRVADNGIGIDPQLTDKIFDVFRRLHTRDEYPGTGMGLAICKRVVERHGGEMWVESDGGAGATFAFSLPAAPGRSEPPAG